MFVIFLNVQSAFLIKKSGHFVYCSYTLPRGFLNDRREHTDRAEQGTRVSAPPVSILNRNFQIFRRRGIGPREQKALLRVTRQVSREVRCRLGTSGSVTPAPSSKRVASSGHCRRRGKRTGHPEPERGRQWRRGTGGRDAGCPGRSALNGW